MYAYNIVIANRVVKTLRFDSKQKLRRFILKVAKYTKG